jgi:hypothetical protein
MLVVLLLSALSVCNANWARKRQSGSQMMEGHDILVNRYWANTDASKDCKGVPYDTTEIDITDGQTCLTIGSLTGYYFQRVPDNTTHYRRCVTDNLACMTNANETCTDFPVALGKCFLGKTTLYEGLVSREVTLYTRTTIEKFTSFRGTKRKIAVEELYDSEDCSGNAKTTKEVWPDTFVNGTIDCVPDASNKSYRAFHNSYTDQSIRICDYAPTPGNLSQSCEVTPYICHVYNNGGCADYPFGGAFKVYLRDAPNPVPPAKNSGSALVVSSLLLVGLLLALFL